MTNAQQCCPLKRIEIGRMPRTRTISVDDTRVFILSSFCSALMVFWSTHLSDSAIFLVHQSQFSLIDFEQSSFFFQSAASIRWYKMSSHVFACRFKQMNFYADQFQATSFCVHLKSKTLNLLEKKHTFRMKYLEANICAGVDVLSAQK